MPSISKITQSSANKVNNNFRIRKVKQFLPCDKIIKKLGKTIRYEFDLPNGKLKEIGFVNGDKKYEMISNGIRSITNYFDQHKNLIQKVKHFYADNEVVQPYKEIIIDKKDNSVTTCIFDLNKAVREATYKLGSCLSYEKFDGNEKLLYKDLKYMTEDGAINHDIYDPDTNGKTLLKSGIKYFDGGTEDVFFKNDKITNSIFKEELDENTIKTEVRKFDKNERLTQLSRSYSDTNEETIYDYIAGTEDVKKITKIDNFDGEIFKEEIDYDGIFNSTGGKVYENNTLKYLIKQSFEGEITEAKTPDGKAVPLDLVFTYPRDTHLKNSNLKEWEEMPPDNDEFLAMYERIEQRVN